ncbi:MAG TPA: universal stress protein [Polyangiaceae bacterium]|nr:universal stress protein [Polyangiaceae bacterium]
MTDFRTLLVPTDFGRSSDAALEIAIDLASKYGAALDVVHVYEFPSYAYMPTAPPLVNAVEEAAHTQFDRAMLRVVARKRDAKGFLREGVPWQQILAVQEEVGADLIVMGTHGRRGVSRTLIGSVAEKVVRMSPVPVLTVHAQRYS